MSIQESGRVQVNATADGVVLKVSSQNVSVDVLLRVDQIERFCDAVEDAAKASSQLEDDQFFHEPDEDEGFC